LAWQSVRSSSHRPSATQRVVTIRRHSHGQRSAGATDRDRQLSRASPPRIDKNRAASAPRGRRAASPGSARHPTLGSPQAGAKVQWMGMYACNLLEFDDSTTPGRQPGYLLHFNGAKQSTTRAAGVERVRDRIMEGFGMHDRASPRRGPGPRKDDAVEVADPQSPPADVELARSSVLAHHARLRKRATGSTCRRSSCRGLRSSRICR
jgi:hypothetical protein